MAKKKKMKDQAVDITCIIDRSGSMTFVAEEVIGSYNSFLKEQREVKGEASITLVQFDDKYQVDYANIPINDAPDLNEDTYQPRGMTAMFDAIGRTITDMEKRFDSIKKKDRPKVILLIQTDGQENASQEYDSRTVKKMIKNLIEDKSWEIVFLGANIDAAETAQNIGINVANSMSYDPNARGTQNAFQSISKNMTNFRTGSKSDMTYDASDYAAQSSGLNVNVNVKQKS